MILHKLPMVCLLIAFCVLANRSVHASDPSRFDKSDVIAQFALMDNYGNKLALADFSEKPVLVLAFLGTECPLAKLYGPRLNEIQERFAEKGVVVIGINSNTQDSITELKAYVHRFKIFFPMLKDIGNRLADAMGATRTPEVFVLDTDRHVRYHGRIDDQYGVGTARQEPKQNDLIQAIEELLAGKPVTNPETPAPGCFIGRTKQVEPHGEITYTKDIAPILNARCVECHRSGEIGPFTLSSYQDVLGWESTILEVIADNRMPPWNANPEYGHFANDARLSESEVSLIKSWIANGMPEGAAKDLPPAPRYAEGWRIPEPDQVFAMDDAPFQIPAQGVVEYQRFEVDPGWNEDKYICAAEARPDNRSVVHHILVYVVPPNGRRTDLRSVLVGYAPGSLPVHVENGLALLVPKGSKLVFEMHYTPNGVAQQDRSYVGVKFIDKGNVTKLLNGRVAIETKFRIPAGAKAHEVSASYVSRSDELLLSMTPHMHLRGKAFRYEAFYPDGSREILLDVPNYDFNWQLKYILAEPKKLVRGTKLVCTAVYDNSSDNLVNPDPSQVVHWGDQSWQEMMIGFFDSVDAD